MKTLLNILIALLIIAILGGAGFIGYALYQDRQHEAPPATVVSRPAAPVSTSVDSPSANQNALTVVCSTAQRQQTIDTILAQNESFNQLLPWLEDDTVETLQDFSKTLLDLDRIITIYQTNYYAQFPACAESIVIREFFDVLYDSLLDFMMLNVLSLYVLQNGDEVTSNIIKDAATRRQNAQNALPDENALIDALRQNSLLPQGMPTCTAEQLAQHNALYAPYITEYQRLFPAYLDFMNKRSGDFSTLFRFEELAIEVFTAETPPCAENFPQEMAYVRIFQDTSLAIHLAQLAAFEQNRGDLTTAEALERIVAQRHERVLANIEVISPN